MRHHKYEYRCGGRIIWIIWDNYFQKKNKKQINTRKNNILFLLKKEKNFETLEINEKERKIESEKLINGKKQLRNKRKRTKDWENQSN